MFDAARTEDVYPVVREGYRTAEEQQEILDDKIQNYMRPFISCLFCWQHPVQRNSNVTREQLWHSEAC